LRRRRAGAARREPLGGQKRIKELGLAQTKAAGHRDLGRPDVSRLMGGRHTGCSVDRLLALLNALEVDIDIVMRPKPHGRVVRRTSPDLTGREPLAETI
jgi:hypothetical protein